jgi:glycosyltransferase involved in cell wall biosynthesis
VDLITDSLVEGNSLPVCLPDGIRVITLIEQTFVAHSKRPPISKVFPLFFSFIGMVRRLKLKLAEEKYDIVHFFGTERMLVVSKLLSLMQCETAQMMTYNQRVDAPLYRWICRSPFFWRQLRAVVVSMEYMKSCIPVGVDVHVVRHGIIKDFSQAVEMIKDGKPLVRVLFWQTPAYMTGVDICIKLFRKLAPLYPTVHFDLAVRAESDLVDMDLYEKEIANGHIFRFPYPDGMTLDHLLAGSICVFQPFREYTYHPQLVILESLLLGIPLVASHLPGADEMIQEDENGFLFPLDRLELAEKGIRKILDSREVRSRLSANNHRLASEKWLWDGYEDRLQEIYAMLK